MPSTKDIQSSSMIDLATAILKSELVLVPRDHSTNERRISGYVNQINIQVAILQELTNIVKSGDYTAQIGRPSKLAVMGFSLGSFITHAAIGSKPDIADAVVLTGIGLNSSGLNPNGLVRSFVPRIASQQDRVRFGSLDNGYLTWVDKFSQINT